MVTDALHAARTKATPCSREGREGGGKQPGIWTKPFIMLLAFDTFLQVSFWMTAPIVPIFCTVMGASLAVSGFVAGLNSMTALFCRPISGILADRANKRRILLVSAILFFASSWGCALADSVAVLAFFRIMQGFSFSIKSTALILVVSEVVPSSRLGESIGWIGLSYVMATAVAPGIATAIGDALGYKATFAASSLFAVGAFVLALFAARGAPAPKPLSSSIAPFAPRLSMGCMLRCFLGGGAKSSERKGLSLSNLVYARALPYALLGGLLSFVLGSITAFVVISGIEKGIDNISLFFTVYAACLVAARPLSGKLFDRKGMAAVVIPGCVITIASMLLLAETTSLFVVLLAAVLLAVGQGSAAPVVQAACVINAEEGEVGIATSTYYIGPDLGQALGPIASGLVFGLFGCSAVYYLSAAIMLLALVMCVIVAARQKRARIARGSDRSL